MFLHQSFETFQLSFQSSYVKKDFIGFKTKTVDICYLDFMVAGQYGVGTTHTSSWGVRKKELTLSQQFKRQP
jgi:hypothetical protein